MLFKSVRAIKINKQLSVTIWSVKWLVTIKNYEINGDNGCSVTYEEIICEVPSTEKAIKMHFFSRFFKYILKAPQNKAKIQINFGHFILGHTIPLQSIVFNKQSAGRVRFTRSITLPR